MYTPIFDCNNLVIVMLAVDIDNPINDSRIECIENRISIISFKMFGCVQTDTHFTHIQLNISKMC